MALAKDVMGGGFSAVAAQAINGAVASSVSAAGTGQSDATLLKASINYVSTVASGAGVQLYDGVIGDSQIVHNAGANALTVYPPSGDSIQVASANAGVTLPTNTTCKYVKVTSTKWIGMQSA